MCAVCLKNSWVNVCGQRHVRMSESQRRTAVSALPSSGIDAETFEPVVHLAGQPRRRFAHQQRGRAQRVIVLLGRVRSNTSRSGNSSVGSRDVHRAA
jgi:hypothetical protein